ncbi:MAG: OmpA family protein [Desulfomicrobium sp.]|uniref:OmpA family protein n=1 Tax=Hoeflea sp. TaxID=1940281 RepID=UPI0025C35291|nr:OmpA family protein [Hoeflea sp.]MBU4527109.1 OmpA family protein [Alphaproteobacteria bacterium]MBV1712050.1 OmpA family protein [Desulfomicrobium sp.]MBU4544994.1 OmpA family protein [Alphaproteobacteria bacterium]MBU4549406.1 OmpA family protein [Alphaproteobacteria bacterium]MBV1786282.1 OmpA family protein [Hoeflea sp.]
MIRSLLSALIVVLLSLGSAQAQSGDPFAGRTPGDLVDLSVDTPSMIERAAIRNYLARNHPNTPEGLFSRAWVADRNGADAGEVARLYSAAVDARPDFVSAIINLAFSHTNAGRHDEARALYTGAMAFQPVDTLVLRNLYFLLKDDLNDPVAADRLLSGADSNSAVAPHATAFIRGIAAQSGGDLSTAESHLARAMQLGGDFEVLERLTNVRLTRLEQQGASTQERVGGLSDMIAFAGRAGRLERAKANLHIAQALRDRLRADHEALGYFEAAYDAYPFAEAATEGFAAMANADFARSYALLDRAARDLPWNWSVASFLSWANFNFRFEPELAERYGRRAIELAELQTDRQTAAAWLGDFHEARGDHAAALQVLEDILPELAGTPRISMLGRIVDNRTGAQDYGRAIAVLDEMTRLGGTNAGWLAQRQERLRTAAALETERKTFYAENPFLEDWEKRFGASLTLAVEFETNSDVIRPDTYPALDTAALALNARGGEKYVFLIEGHTDSRGTDEINMPLSERRAGAVARYLQERHGLPASRLRTEGHGPRQPIASNDTDAGLQRNRRVEIRPYGNVTDPQIAVTSVLDASGLVVSPDGKIGAGGYEPVQLWDLREKVKIRDLYRGNRNRAFSPNGRYLVTLSSYREVSGMTTNALYIYDTKTGHAVAQIHSETIIDSVTWSPFSDAVAYSDRNGFLKVYDIAERLQRGVARMSTLRASGKVLWLADGERIAVGQAQTGSVKLFAARTLRLERELPGVSWTHALGQSADGRYMVAVDNRRQVSIWDTTRWGNPAQIAAPLIPSRIVAHPTRPLVLMNDTFDSSIGLALVDLSSATVLAQRPAEQDLGITFSPDGTRFAAGRGDGIDWYDTSSLRPVETMTGFGSAGRGLSIDTRNNHVISRDTTASYVWDLTTGKRVHTLQTKSKFDWQPLTADGSRQLAVDEGGNLFVFDSDDFSERRQGVVDFSVTEIRSSDKHIVLAGKPRGSDEDKALTGIVEVLDKASLQPLRRFEVPFVTERLRFGQVYNTGFSDLAISDGPGLVALSTKWQDGYGNASTGSRVARIFDITTGAEVRAVSLSNPIDGVRFDRDDPALLQIKENAGGWQVYQAASGRWLRWEPASATFTRYFGEGRTIEFSRDTLMLGDKTAFFPDTLRDVVVHEAQNLVVGLTSANELVFFDLARLERQLTIVIKANDEWIAYAPGGEFTASLGGTNGVFWSLGDNFLPFEALKTRFERPRLIQDRLTRLTERADIDPNLPFEPEQPQVDPEMFQVPYKVELASVAREEVDTESYVLRLRVEKDNAELPDPVFEYKLNGRVVIKSRGFDEEPVFEGGEIVGIDRMFTLQDGANIIEASLVFKDARVLTQRAEITRKVAPAPAAKTTTQLWYFGVGVSDYEISTQNLDYAHKDALELEKTLKAQEGLLFSKVNTKVLVNSDATERGIRVEMNDFLRQASAEDVIIIFLAGHGVQDNEQRLHLITHDGDMERPYTGMQIDSFRDFLSGRPINQKAIFLMDICHAGTVGPRRRGRITAEDAVRALSDGTGTIVVASSTGAQSSLEDESFGGGHGAFTAALLEGMRGAADREAGDGNGFVSVQELISYTARRVPQLTQGAQHPTIPLLENVRDFPLASVE